MGYFLVGVSLLRDQAGICVTFSSKREVDPPTNQCFFSMASIMLHLSLTWGVPEFEFLGSSAPPAFACAVRECESHFRLFFHPKLSLDVLDDHLSERDPLHTGICFPRNRGEKSLTSHTLYIVY